MNGHGSYVWFCYLITFIVILIMIWIPLQRRRQLMAQLKRQLRISEAKALGSNATSPILQQDYANSNRRTPRS